MKPSVLLILNLCLFSQSVPLFAQSGTARVTALTLTENWADRVQNGGSDAGPSVTSQDTVTFNATAIIPGLSQLSSAQLNSMAAGVSCGSFDHSDQISDADSHTPGKAVFYITAPNMNGDDVRIGTATVTRNGDTVEFNIQLQNPASGDPMPMSFLADQYLGLPGTIDGHVDCTVSVGDTHVTRTLYVKGKATESMDSMGDPVDSIQITGAGDFTAPSVTILSPRAGGQVTNSAFTVQARATDNAEVTDVEFSLDGTEAVPGEADPITPGLWTLDVELQPGPHTLTATSFDADGNVSSPASAKFSYVVVAPLTVMTNGHGTVAGATNGQLLQVGATYTLTATAAAGSLFTNWTGSFAGNQSKLTLVMASNAMVQANFVDVTRPSLTITSPAPGAFTTNNNQIIVRGTAKDNARVTSVLLSLNAGPFQALATGTTNWMASMPLRPGTNLLAAKCVDDSGLESATVTNRYIFVPATPLMLVTNPVGKGNKITATVVGRMAVLGNLYTATATPSPNQMFSNWTGTVTSFANPLSFYMQSNEVLRANFITNIFLAAQGNYYGLFTATNEVRNNGNSGAFSFLVTPTGSFTGKLPIGPDAPPLTGHFDVNGRAHVTANRAGKPPLTLDLQLELANQQVHGTVTDGAFLASLDGFQAYFAATRKASFAGQYTFGLPAAADPMVGPYGLSYGTVKVDAAGNVTVGGSLADGAGFSQATVASKDGFWPCYLPLYKGNGSLWGWNQFANQIIYNVFSGSALSWINTTNPTAGALYRSGFTNNNVFLYSSPYVSTKLPLLGFTNGVVLLQGGNLAVPITNHIVIGANNTITVTNAAEKTNKLTLTINKTTGVLTGSFANPAKPTQMIPLSGVVLQSGTNVWGYFLGANQTGTFLIMPAGL